jgi:hypothetical protein
MRLLALLLLLFPFVGFSQITITESDFANTGDTVVMSTTTDPGIDFSSTGTNWTWDFSILTAESQSVFEYYDVSGISTLVDILFGNFAPADYRASYFTIFDDLPIDQFGQFLPVNISNLFQFSRVTADSISSVGIALDVDGNQIPFRSDLIEKRYEFPLNFGDNYTGVGYTEMDLNPFAEIMWRQRRNRSTTVDGWGSITLPMGTFDVLRLKHTIEESDSLYGDFLGLGTPTWFGIDLPTSHIYEWIANGEKEPVLRIETSEAGGNEIVTNIEYRDLYDPSFASLDENAPNNFKLYPNPATDFITIDGPSAGSSFVLLNSKGQQVQEGILPANGKISVSSLQPGFYIFQSLSENGVAQMSFVKQ